jgi:hypothetical protein
MKKILALERDLAALRAERDALREALIELVESAERERAHPELWEYLFVEHRLVERARRLVGASGAEGTS